METCHTTEAEKMARTWFGEIPSWCSLTVLLGPAWVLLKNVLQNILSGPDNLSNIMSVNSKHFQGI